jgi:hypothetical protein
MTLRLGEFQYVRSNNVLPGPEKHFSKDTVGVIENSDELSMPERQAVDQRESVRLRTPLLWMETNT